MLHLASLLSATAVGKVGQSWALEPLGPLEPLEPLGPLQPDGEGARQDPAPTQHLRAAGSPAPRISSPDDPRVLLQSVSPHVT